MTTSTGISVSGCRCGPLGAGLVTGYGAHRKSCRWEAGDLLPPFSVTLAKSLHLTTQGLQMKEFNKMDSKILISPLSFLRRAPISHWKEGKISKLLVCFSGLP